MERKYEAFNNPELLKDRFEGRFPLLYPMDTVEVSTRWEGDGKNPLEGRLGYVHKIGSGLQGRFNRDYFVVGLMGGEEFGDGQNFESWLYTLDLVEKDETSGIPESILRQFGCFLYVDDRITVVSHPIHKGKTGHIISLQGTGCEGGWLDLEVSDESAAEEIRNLYANLHDVVGQEFQKRNVQEGFDNFVLRVSNENFGLYQLLEQKGRTREVCERALRSEIYREHATKPEFQRLKGLQEKSQFFVSSRDVELLERFPPNDLFKRD